MATDNRTHPLQIPRTRRDFLTGWLFGRLCSVPVAVATGALIYLFSARLLPALLAPTVAFAVGLAGNRLWMSRAWADIPPERRATQVPGPLPVAGAVIDAVALFAAVVAMVAANSGIDPEVYAFIVGTGVAIAALQVVEVAFGIGPNGGGGLPQLLPVAAVAASTALIAATRVPVWNGYAGLIALYGAVTVLAVYGIWFALTLPAFIERRRAP